MPSDFLQHLIDESYNRPKAKTAKKQKKEKKAKFEPDPGPSRRFMRNIVRHRNYKQIGTFSGRPKPSSGFTIRLLKGNASIEIDAVYQATDHQFRNWAKYTRGIDLDPEIALGAEDRLGMLATPIS